MATKSKNSCQGKDLFERMSFLYQAANMMAGKNDVLSCYYGRLCKTVAQKGVLRMEPSIKRTICKRCGLILKPGISADLSMDETNSKLFLVTCRKCLFTKRFTINPNYKMWLDDPLSIKEVIRFQRDSSSCSSSAEEAKNLKKNKE